MNVVGHKESLATSASFIQKRGIADFELSEFLHHSLVVDQALEAPLGNFGLVRGVGSIPAGVLQQISLDDAGDNAGIEAASQVGFVHFVFGDGLFEFLQENVLGDRISQHVALQRILVQDIVGDRLPDQLFHAAGLADLEHFLRLCLIGPYVPGELNKPRVTSISLLSICFVLFSFEKAKRCDWEATTDFLRRPIFLIIKNPLSKPQAKRI